MIILIMSQTKENTSSEEHTDTGLIVDINKLTNQPVKYT